MSGLTRRDYLNRLLALLAAAAAGCRGADPFARELVCNHIFELDETLPPPLLSPPASAAELRPPAAEFDIGLPELLLCTTATRFLDIFRTFWPVRRADIERLRRLVEIKLQLPVVRTAQDITVFAEALAGLRRATPRNASRLVVVFTLHGETRTLSPQVARAAVEGGADELVLFKDPSIAPYFCDYPARQQKGW